MSRGFSVLLLTVILQLRSGDSSRGRVLKESGSFPLVSLSYQEQLNESRHGVKETGAVQKEDPTEVEVFSVHKGQISGVNDGREDLLPGSSYPRRVTPFTPFNSRDGVKRQNPDFSSVQSELDAFSARKSAARELRPGAKITFLDTFLRLGVGWNNATSEFVCHSPGIFFFTFSVCGQQSQYFRVTLNHNGIGVVSAYGDLNGYQMASNSVVLRLLQGDSVHLTLDEGGLYEVSTFTGRAYNTFSGFRLL